MSTSRIIPHASQLDNKWIIDRSTLEPIEQYDQLFQKRELVAWWPFDVKGVKQVYFKLNENPWIYATIADLSFEQHFFQSDAYFDCISVDLEPGKCNINQVDDDFMYPPSFELATGNYSQIVLTDWNSFFALFLPFLYRPISND